MASSTKKASKEAPVAIEESKFAKAFQFSPDITKVSKKATKHPVNKQVDYSIESISFTLCIDLL